MVSIGGGDISKTNYDTSGCSCIVSIRTLSVSYLISHVSWGLQKE